MMLEAKDPAIRLFGRTIQFQSSDDSEQNSNLCSSNGSVSPHSVSDKNATDEGVSMDLKLDHGSSSSAVENISEDQSKSSIASGDTQVITEEDKESSSPKASEKDEEEGSSGSQEKPLKKPTEILPCPRCNSTDTKFCYFNNYNVNQPRHFCKNCQRYWTAGGTMRSMVIGAGRRKNKSSCFSHNPFGIPNVLQAHPDGPLSEIAMVEDPPCHDSGMNSDAQKSATISFQSFATLWPNPWNPAHPTSSAPPPGFVPIFAVPPYWGCGPMAAWNATWAPPASASADQHDTANLKQNSLLGKHPRDENQLKTSHKEHCGEVKRTETKVLAPKTLRFDDPSEAAKSSIWTTLGIKNEKVRSFATHAFFGGFQPKGGEMESTSPTSRMLQANPAALSRSFAFQECRQ